MANEDEILMQNLTNLACPVDEVGTEPAEAPEQDLSSYIEQDDRNISIPNEPFQVGVNERAFIDSELMMGSVNQNIPNFSAGPLRPDPNPSVGDQLRWRARKLWWYGNNRLDFAENLPGGGFLRDITIGSIGNDIYIGTIDPDNIYFDNDSLGEAASYLESFYPEGLTFFDHACTLEVPLDDSFVINNPNIKNAKVLNSQAVYNYYIEDYENNTLESRFTEPVLPTPYSVMRAEQYIEAGRVLPREIYNLMTINGQLGYNFYVDTGLGQRSLNIRDSFFRFYSNFTFGMTANQLSLESKYSNLIFDGESSKLLYPNLDRDSATRVTRSYPMYVDISFRTPGESAAIIGLPNRINFGEPGQDLGIQIVRNDAAGILNNSELISGVMDKTLYGAQNPQLTFAKSFDMIETLTRTNDGQPYDGGKSRRNVRLKTWDLDRFIENLEEEFISDSVRLGATSPELVPAIGPGSRLGPFIDIEENLSTTEDITPNRSYIGLVDTAETAVESDTFITFIDLNKQAFRDYIKEKANRLYRKYSDIIKGKKAYSETIFYKLIKSRGGEQIQTFLFKINEHDELLNFIDTQVKMGEEYEYQLMAYQIVYGTKYTYKEQNTFRKAFAFEVEDEPSVQLIELPFAEFTSVVYDAPPSKPFVDFFPFYRDPTRMKFVLQGGAGQRLSLPKYLDESELERIDLIRRSQEIQSGPIFYRGDDYISRFQIFKTMKKPKTYKDFKGYLVAEVEPKLERQNYQKSCSARAECAIWEDDSLLPNTKYYYMFRSIDVHGSYSLPSSTFEVELRTINGAVFPHVQAVVYEPVEPSYKKSFKKYLRISPSSIQKEIEQEDLSEYISQGSADSTGVLEFVQGYGSGNKNLSLGPPEDKVWDKKIRVTITSKLTGNKVNLMLDFNSISKQSSVEVCGDIIKEEARNNYIDRFRNTDGYTSISDWAISDD